MESKRKFFSRSPLFFEGNLARWKRNGARYEEKVIEAYRCQSLYAELTFLKGQPRLGSQWEDERGGDVIFPTFDLGDIWVQVKGNEEHLREFYSLRENGHFDRYIIAVLVHKQMNGTIIREKLNPKLIREYNRRLQAKFQQ